MLRYAEIMREIVRNGTKCVVVGGKCVTQSWNGHERLETVILESSARHALAAHYPWRTREESVFGELREDYEKAGDERSSM